jgi:hypothetical protein
MGDGGGEAEEQQGEAEQQSLLHKGVLLEELEEGTIPT